MKSRRQVLVGSACVLLAPASGAVRAQAGWPSAEAVRIVVPYPPGSSMNVMARVLGDKVASRWKQNVIVDNRAGAGGNIGGEHVAKSQPDGYTLLLPSMAVATNKHLYPSMKWDPLTDLQPVTLICRIPNVMVVPARSPQRTVGDFIRFARAHPGQLNFGSAGAGSSMHLAAELFMKATDTRMKHVPYRGSTQAMTDVIGGVIDVMFATLASAQAHIQAGQVRALGIASPRRAPTAPQIPTIAESGVPGFEMSAWYGLMAPAKTPEAIVERINQDLRWALTDTTVRHEFERTLGMQIVGSTRGQFGDFLAQESSRWGAVIEEAGIRLE